MSQDPCVPSAPTGLCQCCARHNQTLPADPEMRQRTVVIDGSALPMRNGRCQFLSLSTDEPRRMWMVKEPRHLPRKELRA